MRGLDLDTAGPVWFYRPGSDRGRHGAHKNAYRGQDRVIAIGPRAQEVLRPWLRLNLQEYLFQPKEAREAFNAQRRAERKSKVPPSQRARKQKRRPKKKPGERYTTVSYGHAIADGCAKAHAQTCGSCKRQKKEPFTAWMMRVKGCPALKAFAWHPGQLRHTKATEIRREAGIDAARAVLGHRSPAITETYAELDKGKAAEIMERLG
jgi:integrase